MIAYDKFLEQKKHSVIERGSNPVYMPPKAFDFQKHIIDRCFRNGRYAGFIDTGLGKTLIELAIAENHARTTNKKVLIITPLAVAYQFVSEAEKFNICEPVYSKDGIIKSDIVLCNYERLEKFNPDDFDAVILDESSILKNFDGRIKARITTFLKKVKYRYLFTATPSPNDFIELGTSSEALGYFGYMDMLGKFFTNNENTIDPTKIGEKWVLKGHARDMFFDWVSSWSISVRKPSDIGFLDHQHVLPELITRNNEVENKNNQVFGNQEEMFKKKVSTLQEVRREQSQTIEERCERAAELAQDTSVFWCNLNAEADMLCGMVDGSEQIKGSMNIDKKEELLVAFQKGEIKRLITKPKITCFGLNWQHCNHTVYFPTFSYEQYYQAIRRFWRFGQKNSVTVDLVYSQGQTKVIESLTEKARKADELFTKLNKSINEHQESSILKFENKMTKPRFL